ncbi:MAG: LLM class F420-dependent oxidoreductase [Acidimicrobiales bacterium]
MGHLRAESAILIIMHYGALIFPTDYSMHPAALGPALEERGFESFWVPEHSHIPASRVSKWPGGSELPQMYYDTLDPFVTLTAAATATSQLKIGTGIALVVQRDPIHTAKESASLDVLSDGRFMLGVGAGWNIEEMVDHGTDPERRFGRMRESVEAMQAIWRNDVAEYHGNQIDFDAMYSNPKPIQPGGPPIHVGGSYPGALRRAVTYGDGWIPIGGRGGATDLGRQVREAREMCAERDRDPEQFEISYFGAPADADALADIAAAGFDRAIFSLPSAGAPKLIPRLDDLAGLMS